MSKLNHFAIARILDSEILGPVSPGHGQLGSLQVFEDVFDTRRKPVAPDEFHCGEIVDMDVVVQAFHDARDDRKSPDFYVAEPDRNRRFIQRCRALGIQASEYAINKTLLNARKANRLKGLNSERTTLNHDDYAFASEFAATEIRYRTGASVDDIICDPELRSEFDQIASRMAPGHSPLEYRWALLSIRKAGKQVKWEAEYDMPVLSPPTPLFSNAVEDVPPNLGVYLLLEQQRPLYARGVRDVHHGVELHRCEEFLTPLLDRLWRPSPDDLLFSYATLPKRKLVRPVEQKLIREKRPLFNIPVAA
jgi:hypothetical protein